MPAHPRRARSEHGKATHTDPQLLFPAASRARGLHCLARACSKWAGPWPQIFRRVDALLTTAATAVAIVLSFALMALALRSLPFGTAYAVWTGIGAVGSIVVGMLLYSEPTNPVRIICLTLIVAGMVGLKLNSPV